MATGSNIRVGDAERDAVATQLREHYGDGRLTLDELNERIDQTLRARTAADLNAVTRDLPSIGGSWAGAGTGTTRPVGQSGQLLPDQPQWGGQSQGGPRDQGNGFGPRGRSLSAVAAMIPALLAVGAMLLVGGLFAFGPGGGRPLAIMLFFAAMAVIRRIFGGRGRGRARGGRCGRRW